MSLRLKTRPFGEIDVDERQIYEFPEGIPGFDDIHRYALLDSKDANVPFKWLQAVGEPELAFVVIRIVDFMPSYDLVVSTADLEALGTPDAAALVVFAIVTIPEKAAEMTANLQGPIIINTERRQGRQAISLSDRYTVRHRILDEIQKAGGRG